MGFDLQIYEAQHFNNAKFMKASHLGDISVAIYCIKVKNQMVLCCCFIKDEPEIIIVNT